MYHIVLSKQNISKDLAEEIKINESGNCYYHNLSYFFTGTQNYDKFFRKLIYDYIKRNKVSIITEHPYTIKDILENDNKNKNEVIETIEIEDYIENIKRNTFYAGD